MFTPPDTGTIPKMGCTELCRDVDTAQRQTLTQIPIEFCANLSVSISVSVSVSVSVSGIENTITEKMPIIFTAFVCTQEVEMLTTSLSQLKMVQGKLQESQESLSSINTESKSKEILVPLTGSVSFTIPVYIVSGHRHATISLICMSTHKATAARCLSDHQATYGQPPSGHLPRPL